MRKAFQIFAILFFCLLAMQCCGIIYAQSELATKPWWFNIVQDVMGKFPEFNAWLIAFMFFLTGISRAFAEFFSFIATKTETKKDDKWISKINQASWLIASVCDWFGVGQTQKYTEKKTNGDKE